MGVEATTTDVYALDPQGLRKGHWSQLRFHGDEMLRPAASNEIAWLAVVLVRLSMWINRAVGLDRPADEDAQPDNVFQVTVAVVAPCLGHHCQLTLWLLNLSQVKPAV